MDTDAAGKKTVFFVKEIEKRPGLRTVRKKRLLYEVMKVQSTVRYRTVPYGNTTLTRVVQ